MQDLHRTALLVLLFLLLSACSGDDGDAGAPGAAGTPGADGVSCWDLNSNGQGDPDEDLNNDGAVDVADCNALAGGAYETVQLHVGYFTDHDYESTEQCLNCHGQFGADMLTRAHFTWEGVAANVSGHEGEIHGKNDFINNFCIAVPSNEGRCTQCHAGYGYADASFDFGDPENVDCLVCHDQTGTYAKAKTTAGLPAEGVDLNLVARSVADNDGVPSRKNCIGCHANAGGGNNVKHGDLAMSLVDTTREYDVHMGTDGGDLDCVACHGVKKDNDGDLLDHGIGGMPFHSVDEGALRSCEDCHGDRYSIHAGNPVTPVLQSHETLACQVCHIPTIARDTATKTEWYWSEAGQDIDPVPIDEATGRATYDKKKGRFVWANNVRPSLLYSDGKWDRVMINTNDSYTEVPVVLAAPSADHTTPGAMIYPFKKMIGDQVADADNRTMLVPHLFGMKGGANPYWAKYDWDLALRDGAAYTGQTYSGNFEFVDTVMYLSVNHEVAPRAQSLGKDGACGSCHFSGQYDWTALGWSDDPTMGGER